MIPIDSQTKVSAPANQAERQWRTLAGRMFADLGRARITPRQALIMEILVRVTLLVGRQSVRIPRLAMFGVFGLSPGNVSEALRGKKSPNGEWVPGLVELGLVQVVESNDGGAVFTILPDATQWRCAWRFGREAETVFLKYLDAVAGQVQGELSALIREPGLTEAMAEVSLDNALDPPCSQSRNASDQARSQSGNEAKTPGPARSAGHVPTLGTGPGSGGSGVPNEETFNRFVQKRINVQNVSPGVPVVPPARSQSGNEEREIFASALRERVRNFVGEADWNSERWWNRALGYRSQFFYGDDALLMRDVLCFCENGIATGEVVPTKNKGSLLWYEFQRTRREKLEAK